MGNNSNKDSWVDIKAFDYEKTVHINNLNEVLSLLPLNLRKRAEQDSEITGSAKEILKVVHTVIDAIVTDDYFVSKVKEDLEITKSYSQGQNLIF